MAARQITGREKDGKSIPKNDLNFHEIFSKKIYKRLMAIMRLSKSYVCLSDNKKTSFLMDEKSFLEKLFRSIQIMRTMTLVSLLFGIGGAILVLRLLLIKYGGDVFTLISVSLFSFFCGLSGLVVVIRRELDLGIIYFKGFTAVIYGGVMTISGFFTSAVFFWAVLRALKIM